MSIGLSFSCWFYVEMFRGLLYLIMTPLKPDTVYNILGRNFAFKNFANGFTQNLKSGNILFHKLIWIS